MQSPNEGPHLVVLKCSSCGANLDITPDLELFACGFCGTQQMVRRTGNTVSLKVIGEAVAAVSAAAERIEDATDRVALELKLQRLRDDLDLMEEASFGIDTEIAELRRRKPSKREQEWWIVLVGLPIGLPLAILLVLQIRPDFCPGALLILFTPGILSVLAMMVAREIKVSKLTKQLKKQQTEFDAAAISLRVQIQDVLAQLD